MVRPFHFMANTRKELAKHLKWYERNPDKAPSKYPVRCRSALCLCVGDQEIMIGFTSELTNGSTLLKPFHWYLSGRVVPYSHGDASKLHRAERRMKRYVVEQLYRAFKEGKPLI